MKYLITTIVLILLFSSFGHTKLNSNNENIIEGAEWMKSKSAFRAQLFVIDDENSFLNQWKAPSASIQISTISVAERGESLFTPIILSGCSADSHGNCKVEADINLLKPDGSIYIKIKDAKLWVGKPKPPKEMLVLGEEYLAIEMSPECQLGIYTVEAIATDKIKNTSIRLIQKFTLTEGSKQTI